MLLLLLLYPIPGSFGQGKRSS
ncbi:MAG: hypothetical protein ACMUIM_06615 [bacterium]